MWTKLRNAFIAAKKRRKTKSGQAAKKIAPWKFEKEMSFLIPFLEMRETCSNLETRTNDEDEEEPDSEEHPTELLDNTEVFTSTQTQGERNEEKSARYISATNRKSQNPAHEMVQIMKRNAAIREKRYDNKPPVKDLDEVDMFYLSMAKTVKRLSKLEQAKIRMTLCQLVSEAEIRSIDGSAGEYTTTSSLGSVSSLVSPPAISPMSEADQVSMMSTFGAQSSSCPSTSNFSSYTNQYHNL